MPEGKKKESVLERKIRETKAATDAAMGKDKGGADSEARDAAKQAALLTAPLPEKLGSAKMTEEERKALRLPGEDTKFVGTKGKRTMEARPEDTPEKTTMPNPAPSPTPKAKSCRTVTEKTKFGSSKKTVCD
jgi:hypothetical protein